MIDLKSERLLTLAQAARVRPPSRGGRPTHPSTILRWITRGLGGQYLEAVRLGGQYYTSVEALQRFAGRLAGECPTATAREGTREAGVANDALNELGY